MWRDKAVMLPFRSSLHLLNSTSSSKLSILCNRVCTNVTCSKPSSPIFLRCCISSRTGRLQEQLHASQPATPTQSSSKYYSGVASLDKIAKGVVHLQCESSAEGGVCHVYLVGTCHLSQRSCKEVKAVISYLKPQVVFIESCTMRSFALTDKNHKVLTMSEVVSAVWKNKKASLHNILYCWLFAKIRTEVGFDPPAEFRVAYEEARRYGAHVALGDRPIDITIGRMQHEITTLHIHEILFSNKILKMIEDFKDEDLSVIATKMLQMEMKQLVDRNAVNEIMQEMSNYFPSFMEVLIVERDKYMSHTLLTVAREHSSVVAVVGRGHLSGIEKNWMQPVEVQSLLEMPSEKKGFNVLNMCSSIKAAANAVLSAGNNLWSRK